MTFNEFRQVAKTREFWIELIATAVFASYMFACIWILFAAFE